MGASLIDKGILARNFSGAAGTYDRWATAQAQIARSLVLRLPSGFEPASIVDLGCGTGLLSAVLLERFSRSSLIGIDLADKMVAICRERWPEGGRARFILADAEQAGSLLREVDLVASSCALQWFMEPAATLALWAGALRPGGVLALATLGSGSFAELDAAHRAALGAPLPGLRLLDAPGLESLVREAGLEPEMLVSECVTIRHADARAALRSFHQTGALLSSFPGRAPLSLTEVRRLIGAYDRLRDESGAVPMTYRSLQVLARGRP